MSQQAKDRYLPNMKQKQIYFWFIKYSLKNQIMKSSRAKVQNAISLQPKAKNQQTNKLRSSSVQKINHKKEQKHSELIDIKICSVCLSSYPTSQMASFSQACRHQCCKSCLQQYIRHRIKNGQIINCVNYKCKEALNQQSIHFRDMNIEQKKIYSKILIYQEKKKHPNRMLCSYPNCKGYVLLDKAQLKCIICDQIYCKDCFAKKHSGSCDDNQAIMMQKKLNLARCNNCRMLVQKIQGCNHITCRCGHQFCYICRELWLQNHVCIIKPRFEGDNNNANSLTFRLRFSNIPNRAINRLNQRQAENCSILYFLALVLKLLMAMLTYFGGILVALDIIAIAFMSPLIVLSLLIVITKAFYFEAILQMINQTCYGSSASCQERIIIILKWLLVVFPFWQLFTRQFANEATQTFNYFGVTCQKCFGFLMATYDMCFNCN